MVGVSPEDHMSKKDQTKLSETRIFTHEQFMSALRLDILERLDSLGNCPADNDCGEFDEAMGQVMALLRRYEAITKNSAYMYDLTLQSIPTIE